MRDNLIHSWDVNFEEAKKIQGVLRERLVFSPFNLSCFLVAGIDVSYNRLTKMASAAIVILDYPGFVVKDVSIARIKVDFPYVPGFLSFREGPAIMEAWKNLKREPDLLTFDAHGIAHPRHFGLACHMGVLLDKPSIGCAKNHFYGNLTRPDLQKGAYSYVFDPKDNSILGAALRTRQNVKCVYVSPGQFMDVPSALRIMLNLTSRFRIPEPLRLAHNYSKKGYEGAV